MHMSATAQAIAHEGRNRIAAVLSFPPQHMARQTGNAAVADDDVLTANNGMTRADAGSLGGQTTKALYGDTGFYRKIGRLGGKARGKKKS
jgi:hypothetical protein